MKTWNLLLIVVAIVALISLILVWFVPSVYDFMAGNSMWNGIKSTMKDLGGTTIDSLEGLPASPEESILISVPYLKYNQSDLETLKNYVENGGTLLLADDYGFGNELLAYLGVTARFNGSPLLDPLFCYENPWLPKITDFAPDISGQGITQVVFNHATAIDNVADNDVLAWSSPTSFLDSDANGKLSPNETAISHPVTARLPLGNGNLILNSDPSILINSMMNKYDNLTFVRAILKSDSPKQVYFDVSHLSEAPLDTAKKGLTQIREFLALPYPTLVVIGIAFIAATVLLLRTGGSIGKQL